MVARAIGHQDLNLTRNSAAEIHGSHCIAEWPARRIIGRIRFSGPRQTLRIILVERENTLVGCTPALPSWRAESHR